MYFLCGSGRYNFSILLLICQGWIFLKSLWFTEDCQTNLSHPGIWAAFWSMWSLCHRRCRSGNIQKGVGREPGFRPQQAGDPCRMIFFNHFVSILFAIVHVFFLKAAYFFIFLFLWFWCLSRKQHCESSPSKQSFEINSARALESVATECRDKGTYSHKNFGNASGTPLATTPPKQKKKPAHFRISGGYDSFLGQGPQGPHNLCGSERFGWW